MGLFSKKYCDICGEQIKFLGNRKVEDGNMCKTCAEKLSPWFSDRRSSTLENIREQLRDREANKDRVEAFHADRTYGEYCRVMIDDEKGQFIVLTQGRGLKDNPDVLSLDSIRDIKLDVREHKTEQTQRDQDNKVISYDPPRYTYTYDFLLDIDLDHPYIDDMRFQVNRSSVKIEAGIPYERNTILGTMKGFTPNPPDLTKNEDYQKYEGMLHEIRDALTARPAPAQAERVCPHCMAKTPPDENGKCPYCGCNFDE